MTEPQLSIIIVNWNGIRFLPDCLRSIVDSPPETAFEIVVVDNASSDGSVEWMRSSSCRAFLGETSFRLIESGSNLGFGQANNLAINNTTAPYVFILNPDTLVRPEAIETLLNTLRSVPSVGAVGPKVLHRDGSLHPSVVNYHPTPLSILIRGFMLDRLIPKRWLAKRYFGDKWEHDEKIVVPLIGGAAMMCRREMFDTVGTFDPEIHMYSEEFELLVRAARGGWKVMFEPEAEIVHLGGKSSEQRWDRLERAVIQEKATLTYYKKCFSPTLNFFNGVATVFVINCHALRWKMTERDTTLLCELSRAHLEHCRQMLAIHLTRIRPVAEAKESTEESHTKLV
jgi:GT2 family glycosyltransferase